ncbi:MAG TPA: PAS domain S-box protein [Thermoplasmatales archaeon]|nr:PAS domain S-box protein [Thermoplasmatales archaeon]
MKLFCRSWDKYRTFYIQGAIFNHMEYLRAILSWPYGIIILLVAGSIVASSSIIILVLRKGFRNVNFFFPLTMASVLIWSAGYLGELLTPEKSVMILLSKIEYIGISLISFGWFMFCAQYTGRVKKITEGKYLYPLLLIPLVTMFLAWTNELHGLIWTHITTVESGPYVILDITYGIWFWIYSAYSYLLLTASTFLLISHAMKGASRARFTTIILAALIPWTGQILYITNLSFYLDFTPVAFSIGGAILLFGIYNYRIFDFLPIARNAVIEQMVEGIIVCDAQNVITDMNPASERIFGISKRDAMGKKAPEVFKDCVELVKLCEDEGAKEKTCEHKGRYYRAKPSTISGHGIVLGKLILIEDVTKQKKAEQKLRESKQRFEDIARSSADWIWEVDREGKYVYVSGKVKRILGYAPKELIGKTPFSLMPKEEGKRIREIFQKIASKKENIVDLENWNVTKDGRKVCFLTNGVPILDEKGNLIGYRGVDKDITERKKAERKITELNETLRLINKIMRHDILNDLQIADSSLELYSEEKNEAFMEKARERIHKSIALIEKMKGLEATISSGKGLKEYHVGEVVNAVVKNYEVNCTVRGDCTVMADEAFYSVIDNLVRNAVVHGKTDKIDITIEGRGNECEIRIADHGRGIPDEIKKKLFEQRFRHGDTAGTGLGLYIVKKTIERYGGSIRVEDNEPVGTVFVITLKQYAGD